MHTNLEIKTKTHCKDGGGQKSGVLDRGPCGWRAQISAKFRKLFLSSHVQAFDRDRSAPAAASSFTGPSTGEKHRGAAARGAASRGPSKIRLTRSTQCARLTRLASKRKSQAQAAGTADSRRKAGQPAAPTWAMRNTFRGSGVSLILDRGS